MSWVFWENAENVYMENIKHGKKTTEFICEKYEMQDCCSYLLGAIARLSRLTVRDLNMYITKS